VWTEVQNSPWLSGWVRWQFDNKIVCIAIVLPMLSFVAVIFLAVMMPAIILMLGIATP
jgi:hypothetical protein